MNKSVILVSDNIENLICQMEETFSVKLLRKIDEKNSTDAEVYKKAYLDRRHFAKIRNNINYQPSKKTVLALAIALELTITETKELLASAGFALSSSLTMDVIIQYFIEKKIYDMYTINEVLYKYDQPTF